MVVAAAVAVVVVAKQEGEITDEEIEHTVCHSMYTAQADENFTQKFAPKIHHEQVELIF